MRKLVGGALAATCLITACQGSPGGVGASPRAAASVKPSVRPSGATTPAERPVLKLDRPTAAATAIKGTVRLDAGYLVGRGGAKALDIAGERVVGADGGTLVGADGATLVGPDGASAIANAAGQIVAAGAGNVVPTTDTRLIGPDGATLIGMDGGTLVGPDGASLVGADGASMVAAGAGNLRVGAYALAQAAAPAVGEAAPVAGALVGALDLRTGRPVAIGQAGGKPVYLAYTDAAGAYEIFLDPAVAPHVMIVSSSPGTSDGRLAANVLANLGSAGRVDVDELASTVTNYLRTCVAVRIEDPFASDEPTSFLADNFDATLRGLLAGPTRELAAAGVDAGYRGLGPAARRRAVQGAIDAALARMDIQGVAMVPEFNRRNKLTGTALEVMRQAMGTVTARTKVALDADPRFYEKSAVVGLANQLRPADRPWTIAKPGDMNDLLVNAFLARRDDELTDQLPLAMVELGADPTLGDSVEAAGLSFFLALAQALFVDAEGFADAKRAFAAAVAREVKAARPEPAEGPAPTPPAVAAVVPTIVATLPPAPPRVQPTAEPDGDLPTPRLPLPIALDASVDPPLVYVGDPETKRLYRVAADGSATPLASAGKPIDAVIGGLAVGPTGDLYATFRADHQVARIGNPRGQVDAVEIVAGLGAPTTLLAGEDGPKPGAEAGFNQPEGLAFGPDGALYVVDAINRRIRRVDLASPARTVTTWAGGVTVAMRDGKLQPVGEAQYAVGRDARFHHPAAIAFGPGGAYILDRGDGRLRLARPSEPGRPDEAGLVTTIGGGNDLGIGGGNGAALMAKLVYPYALAAAPDGRVYVGDPGHRNLRAWLPGSWFVTVAQAPDLQATGLALAPDGKTLWVANGEARTLSRVALP